MKIYCMSDIHGCYSALCDALELVIDHLDEPDTKLIFLGDYIHGGEDNIAVLKKIVLPSTWYLGKRSNQYLYESSESSYSPLPSISLTEEKPLITISS